MKIGWREEEAVVIAAYGYVLEMRRGPGDFEALAKAVDGWTREVLDVAPSPDGFLDYQGPPLSWRELRHLLGCPGPTKEEQ